MKRICIALAMAALFAGCQKPEFEISVESKDVFSASVEEFGAQTKTAMNSDKHVVWSANDRLAIFRGSTLAAQYQVTDASVGQSNGKFTLVATAGDDFYAGNELPSNIAFYPYSENLSLSGTTLEGQGTAYNLTGVVLPQIQTYAENSFANGAFLMAAVTESQEDRTLNFQNVLGAMKLQLKGTQVVKSIKVEGANGEKLSGAAAVTAYADNLAPAITMAGTDDASKSVTLDCGDGVQLSASEATSFYIALPPVLFSEGFTVTVADSEDKVYTVSANIANTILRSSILVMPPVTLNADGGTDTPEEGEDDATFVEYVFLSKSSLTMMPNTSYTLVADIDPVDVTYPDLTWSSSDNSVAEVNQSGKVTAKSDGDVTITALAVGGEKALCSVTVKTPKTFATGDYIDYVDELGVNHGKGVAVAGVIWAPVNCGYEPATADYKGYPYGKLYQWGRKYGQGYYSNDATYPSGENLVAGPVMPSLGSSETYKDVFFYGSYDWCNTQIDDLWVDSEGKKTKKDPCPTGWRVPTYDELTVLCKNYSWSTKDNQNGPYFVGEYTYIDGLPQVFFPAAGYLNCFNGDAYLRGNGGYYWSSRPDDGDDAYHLYFSSGHASMSNDSRANGYSVRCVQD